MFKDCLCQPITGKLYTIEGAMIKLKLDFSNSFGVWSQMEGEGLFVQGWLVSPTS